MLKTASGEQAMGRSQTFQWFSRFKAGRTSIDDDERSGQPVSSSTPEMTDNDERSGQPVSSSTPEMIDDDERSGRPVSGSTPEMIERVRQIIREDRRRTIDEISMLVGISHGKKGKVIPLQA